jgi:hypothetical protein
VAVVTGLDVSLECHDDLYNAICGWHHQPDPIPAPTPSGRAWQPDAPTTSAPVADRQGPAAEG